MRHGRGLDRLERVSFAVDAISAGLQFTHHVARYGIVGHDNEDFDVLGGDIAEIGGRARRQLADEFGRIDGAFLHRAVDQIAERINKYLPVVDVLGLQLFQLSKKILEPARDNAGQTLAETGREALHAVPDAIQAIAVGGRDFRTVAGSRQNIVGAGQ